MDFRFSADQMALSEASSEFFRGECPPDRLRSLDEGTESGRIWTEMADLGLLGILAPDTAGGMGLDPVDAVLVAEAAGEVALPEPFIETTGLVVPALTACGRQDLVAKVVDGSLHIALAHPASPLLNCFVKPDAVLFVSNEAVTLADIADVALEPRSSVDPLRSLSQVNGTSKAEILMQGEQAAIISAKTVAHGAVFTSAFLLGLTTSLINQATDYAKSREQFGQPIGAFQAVKHMIANTFTKLEFARPCTYRAAAALGDSAAKTDVFVSHAKLAAMEAASMATEVAIQVHGAMGYTYEVDLHFWMKRAWALSGLWGDQAFHERRLEKAVLEDTGISGAVCLFA